MAADKWYKVPWNVGHMVALRAYTSRQTGRLKVYLFLRNEINKNAHTWGQKYFSNSVQDFEQKFDKFQNDIYLFIKAHHCRQSPIVLVGSDAFRISWRDCVVLIGVNFLWQYKKNFYIIQNTNQKLFLILCLFQYQKILTGWHSLFQVHYLLFLGEPKLIAQHEVTCKFEM